MKELLPSQMNHAKPDARILINSATDLLELWLEDPVHFV
jgi:hypothetical protein